jgi:pilus assembly protein CpaB
VNPRQRRGVLLLILAAIGAGAVFFSVRSFVAEVRSRVGPEVTVLKLTREVPAFQPIPSDAVEPVSIPERWAPDQRIDSTFDFANTVAGTTLAPDTYLQEGMLVEAPELNEGEREIAILVSAETGVAYKLLPNQRVDIYATFAGDDQVPPCAGVIATNARIIEVGASQTRQTQTEQGAFEPEEVVPVTFALDRDDIERLVYAESFAVEVRLVRVREGEVSPARVSRDCPPRLPSRIPEIP